MVVQNNIDVACFCEPAVINKKSDNPILHPFNTDLRSNVMFRHSYITRVGTGRFWNTQIQGVITKIGLKPKKANENKTKQRKET